MTNGTDAFTAIHFAWIAVLAVLVVVAIVVGIAKKRGRVEAQREVEEHAAEAGVEAAAPAPEERAASPAPLPPAPLASAPPPIADQPAPGTPPAFGEPAAGHSLADEPIAAVAPDGTTATVAMDPAAAETASPADGPVTQLKGLGPKVAARLSELGIDRVGQLAALNEAQTAGLDAAMGPFQGRIARDRWIEQARLLAAGDREGFERVFGKL